MLRAFLFWMTAIWLLTSCSKGGRPVEQQRRTDVGVNIITVDPLLFKVEVNNAPFIPSMTSPGSETVTNVRYLDPAQRFRITNLYTNRLVLDTLLYYKTTAGIDFTFIPKGSGDDLVWLGPPVNEPPVPAGKVKIAVMYV